MMLADAIVEVNGVGDSKFLKSLVNYADKKCIEKLTTLATEGSEAHHRNVYGYPLQETSALDKKHFQNIQNEITKAYSHYKAKFPFINVGKLLQVDLLKYEEGGGYFYHTDNYGHGRTLSIILNLNEGYEGGDLVFGHQNLRAELKRIKLKSGTLCFFPSNFLYPHKIERITKGIRYSVVAWLG
mgnify:CR=1 FL=1